jgi:hypothetical protein
MGEEDARPREGDDQFLPEALNGDDSEASPEEGTQEGDWVEDISDTVAPSVGPHSRVVHHAHPDYERSTLDAMGLDKRRPVVGGQYGVSFGRQAALYGGALAITAALVIGFILLAKELDKSPETFPDKAPWATVPSASNNHATNPSKIDLGH